MKRRVSRASTPRVIPTLGQIAAALVIATASQDALARVDAGTQEDAGNPTEGALLILDVPADAGPVAASVDGVEQPLRAPIAVTPGRHRVRFEALGGHAWEEIFLVDEGETKTIQLPAGCRYDNDIPLGGVPPPPPPSSGCCGRHGEYAGLDLRAIGAAAVAIAFTARRRRKT